MGALRELFIKTSIAIDGWWKEQDRRKLDWRELHHVKDPGYAFPFSSVRALAASMPKVDDISDEDRFLLAGTVAIVLTDVQRYIADSAMEILGRKAFGERESALMGEFKFRRLLSTRDHEEKAEQFRRMVAGLPGRAVNIAHLGASIYLWNDTIRAAWAFDYYGAHGDAPYLFPTLPRLLHDSVS
jgi:CRISPR type I-E-associated protein CasB/Cse2